MFICEIWLFVWYFPQFCTSDMSKYGYLEVFQSPFDFEITRVDCICRMWNKCLVLNIVVKLYIYYGICSCEYRILY